MPAICVFNEQDESFISLDDLAAVRLDADNWVANLRHTVRFAAALGTALADGHRVFTELSQVQRATHGRDVFGEGDLLGDREFLG